MKKRSLYYYLFAVLMVLLLAPLLQYKFDIIGVKKLKNFTPQAPEPELTFDSYRSGKFQAQSEKYLSERYGFRPVTIRLYNQYLYTCYKKTCSAFFTPGKDGWMYYRPGVLDYYGLEAPKHLKSREKAIEGFEYEIGQMNELRSILKNDFGIEYLTFIAPDKAFIYPEHLPDMDRDTSIMNPADYFSRRLKETGFPNVDMTAWFKKIKDTTTMELFKPMDSHWEYMAAIGYDSLFRFMDSLNNFGIPKTHVERITKTVTSEKQDDEKTLNLLFRNWWHTNSYTAEVSVTTDSTTRKPKVLFVGDSFIFALESQFPIKQVLKDKEIWFYYDDVWAGFDKKTYRLKDINKLKSVLKADFVVYYSVGHQWWSGTGRFTDDILRDIKDPKKVAIAQMMIEMENKPYLMQEIKKKAQDRGVSVEKMLELDAKWIIEHKNK